MYRFVGEVQVLGSWIRVQGIVVVIAIIVVIVIIVIMVTVIIQKRWLWGLRF